MELLQVVANLKSAVHQVWDSIGYDAQGLCDGENECAVAMCIASHRLSEFANDDAEQVLRSAIDEHGFLSVVQALSKEISLM